MRADLDVTDVQPRQIERVSARSGRQGEAEAVLGNQGVENLPEIGLRQARVECS